MKQDLRQRELAKIHILKKQLALDDETYRAMLQNIGGAESSKDLTALGRGKVLDHLLQKKGRQPFPGRPNTADLSEQIQKIEAFLAEAKRPWAYVLGMCKRICKKDRLEFCTPAELGKLIAALSYDAKRHGRRQ